MMRRKNFWNPHLRDAPNHSGNVPLPWWIVGCSGTKDVPELVASLVYASRSKNDSNDSRSKTMVNCYLNKPPSQLESLLDMLLYLPAEDITQNPLVLLRVTS